jgi:hypothetical protein
VKKEESCHPDDLTRFISTVNFVRGVSGILALNHVNLLDHPHVIWNQHLLGQVVWHPRLVFCQFFMNICMKETYHTETGYSTYANWNVWFGSTINQYVADQ